MNLKHVVYRIHFLQNIKNSTYPYYYIGSKSYCTFDGKNLIDRDGKVYYTSGKLSTILMKSQDYLVEILCEVEDLVDLIPVELKQQLHYNALEDDIYANMMPATGGNFCNPDFVTVKTADGKSLRVSKKDFEEGDYVGVSKGWIWINDGVKNKTVEQNDLTKYLDDGWVQGRLIDCKGRKNNFYGKQHTEETKAKLSAYNKRFSQTERGKELTRQFLARMQKLRDEGERIGWQPDVIARGLKRSYQTCKFYRTAYNIITHKSERVTHEDFRYLVNRRIWMTKEMYNRTLNPLSFTCSVCGETAETKSAYIRYHEDNCVKSPICKRFDNWKPWEKETKPSRLYILSKLDFIWQTYQQPTTVNRQTRMIFAMLRSHMDIDRFDETFIKQLRWRVGYFHFNPLNNQSWKAFKERYDENQENHETGLSACF